METSEPMKALRQKLLELRKHRENIKREDDLDKRAMGNMEDEIKTLEASLEKKQRQIADAESRLARYDDVLGHSQTALEKLTENTKRLENVIESELASMKE